MVVGKYPSTAGLKTATHEGHVEETSAGAPGVPPFDRFWAAVGRLALQRKPI